MQESSKSPAGDASGRMTRPNTAPNPNLVPRPTPTYRAKPARQIATGNRDLLADQRDARLQSESSRRRTRLAVFLALGLLIAGGIAAYAYVYTPVKHTLDTARTVITHVFVTPVPVRPAPEGGPNATPVPVVYPDWSKQEPVNILLLGLDYRPEEKDSRSDTMIIVHIDPANKTAAMVSIPRDMWVEIPGHGEERINAAFQMGEDYASTTPGGGPGLAMATVEKNFGIKIHYFVQVDFTGFERIVDAMGGLTLDVKRPLTDNSYPLGDYGTSRIYIPAGLQHMDGRTALQYARSRHADSDLGRNERQQQVLLALRQQGLSLDLLPHLNDMLSQLSDAVRTDLSLTQVGSLAQLAKQIDRNSIQTVLISADMLTETTTPAGADVLVPNWDLIRPAIQEAFSDPKLANEAARIGVQNGTTTGGIARKLGDELTTNGIRIVDLTSAPDQGQHPTTTIIDYTGGTKPRTIEVLLQDIGLDKSAVREEPAANAPNAGSDGNPLDILVIAGDDRLNR